MNQVIPVMENIQDRNDKIAAELNRELTGRQVFAVNVMGCPGAGKTTCLTYILPKLPRKSFVIEGDIASDIDTIKLTELGIATRQINTGGACHLDSPLIENAVPDDFSDGFLFIENIGNLVCPAEFMIGEHIKLLISSVTEGSDKPYKYPLAFEKADLILLNKCDLIPYLNFDEELFTRGVRQLNPSVPIIKVSGQTGEGFDEAAKWLTERVIG